MTTMRDIMDDALCNFRRIPCLTEAEQWHLVEVDFTDAPHGRPRPLQSGQRAVYLFFRGEEWLRIGQTGYSQRFTSQHYGTKRASSTFAKDVWLNRCEFGFSGNEDDIDHWIMQNCGRANVLLPAQWPESVSLLLESYLHYLLTPRFEGRRV